MDDNEALGIDQPFVAVSYQLTMADMIVLASTNPALKESDEAILWKARVLCLVLLVPVVLVIVGT